MLPEIKKGTITSVTRNIKTDSSYLVKIWSDMLINNTILFEAIHSSSEAFSSREEKEAFLKGAFSTYALFVSQVEADQMDSYWG
tara:strand:+ start:138 stop:389 length:252 start_codon:yes stop_codon:yes gene_type:complete